MLAVMFLPLNGLGHAAADHGTIVEFSLVGHEEGHGHSHDFDDEDVETAFDESDHHHGDHTHEKASTPPWLGQIGPQFASAGFTLGHDHARPDRLYGIDRPPRPSSLV
jgi:hypothetical protein